MGRAEDLFARLRSGGAAEVEQLIANAQVENLWLDFKQAGNDGKGSKLHESDWKNLAKALSGFANSDGGVILWG
jgi:predicted HTH transcriptional regulator